MIVTEQQQLVSALRQVLPEGTFYPLHEPYFSGNEKKYVDECIDTGWVSSVGAFVDRFEKDLENFTSGKKAILTVNGTAALHAAYQLVGVKPGDEVLMPALTFVATAAAATYLQASPHFVDSEEITMGVCPVKLRAYLQSTTKIENRECVNIKTGRVIRALVVMHVFGHPCQLDELKQVCDDFHLKMVEDAAEALGSYYKGQHVGLLGDVATLSFNGNKTITTGGGGAIITNNIELGDRAKHLTTTAKKPHAYEYEHDEIGFNYRMPNINAALGCAQLEQLPDFLKAKRVLHQRYTDALKTVDGISLINEPEQCQSNYWLQALRLQDADIEQRKAIIEDLNREGIMCRPIWQLIANAKPYQHFPRADLTTAQLLEAQVVNIPSGVALSHEQ